MLHEAADQVSKSPKWKYFLCFSTYIADRHLHRWVKEVLFVQLLANTSRMNWILRPWSQRNKYYSTRFSSVWRCVYGLYHAYNCWGSVSQISRCICQCQLMHNIFEYYTHRRTIESNHWPVKHRRSALTTTLIARCVCPSNGVNARHGYVLPRCEYSELQFFSGDTRKV